MLLTVFTGVCERKATPFPVGVGLALSNFLANVEQCVCVREIVVVYACVCCVKSSSSCLFISGASLTVSCVCTCVPMCVFVCGPTFLAV